MRKVSSLPVGKAMKDYFMGSHLHLELFDRTQLSEADVEDRLRKSGGAHQPAVME